MFELDKMRKLYIALYIIAAVALVLTYFLRYGFIYDIAEGWDAKELSLIPLTVAVGAGVLGKVVSVMRKELQEDLYYIIKRLTELEDDKKR